MVDKQLMRASFIKHVVWVHQMLCLLNLNQTVLRQLLAAARLHPINWKSFLAEDFQLEVLMVRVDELKYHRRVLGDVEFIGHSHNQLVVEQVTGYEVHKKTPTSSWVSISDVVYERQRVSVIVLQHDLLDE